VDVLHSPGLYSVNKQAEGHVDVCNFLPNDHDISDDGEQKAPIYCHRKERRAEE
jgi:hypothetical protein